MTAEEETRGIEDPRFKAGLEMLRRTGAHEVDIRYQDDKEPLVWLVGARWKLLRGKPVDQHTPGVTTWDFAAGLNPLSALLRLLEEKIDGGSCAWCHRPTWFERDLPEGSPFDDLATAAFCVYAWDPELSTFRRGCEGDS